MTDGRPHGTVPGDLTGWRFLVQPYSVASLAHDFYVYRECVGEYREFIEPIAVYRELRSEAHRHEIRPTLQLEQQELQQLMDQLWHAGIRPSNGEGAAGQIGALREHLADMRKIAFGMLNVGAAP